MYTDLSVTEKEVIEETKSKSPLLNVQRIRKKLKDGLQDRIFIFLNSDVLPNEVKLNHVILKVNPYMIPVKSSKRASLMDR